MRVVGKPEKSGAATAECLSVALAWSVSHTSQHPAVPTIFSLVSKENRTRGASRVFAALPPNDNFSTGRTISSWSGWRSRNLYSAVFAGAAHDSHVAALLQGLKCCSARWQGQEGAGAKAGQAVGCGIAITPVWLGSAGTPFHRRKKK